VNQFTHFNFYARHGVGIGFISAAMMRNLARDGFEVVGFDVAARDVAERVEVVITALVGQGEILLHCR
jgi:UDP-N-acetyl-D-mannosaminuronate dehydrogenase